MLGRPPYVAGALGLPRGSALTVVLAYGRLVLLVPQFARPLYLIHVLHLRQ